MNSARLKMAIEEAGYSQKSLAEKLGYSKNTFNLKVNGKIPITVSEANSILDKLGIIDPIVKSEIFLPSPSRK